MAGKAWYSGRNWKMIYHIFVHTQETERKNRNRNKVINLQRLPPVKVFRQ